MIHSGIAKTFAAAALCTLLVAGCTKHSPDDNQQGDVRLEVVGIGLNKKQQTLPGTRAVASSDGNTAFTDGDGMSLFLRGDKYTSVDNRKVAFSKPSSAAGTWTIDGGTIWLGSPTAVVSLVFPYSASAAIDNIPLTTGPYNVETLDVVWKQQQVDASTNEASVTDMKHALARVKILLKRDDPANSNIPDKYTGNGEITAVTLDNGTAAGTGTGAALFTAGKLDMTALSPAPPVTGTTAGAVTDNTARRLSVEGTTADLLVLPIASMVENLVTLKVNVDGAEMTKSLPFAAPADKWEAGKCYTYTVTVKSTQVVFDKVVTTEWNPGETQQGDLDEQLAIGTYRDGGIVFWIDPDDATHYKIVSPDEAPGVDWSDARTWARTRGKGWYLPTKEELTELYNARKNSGGSTDLAASRIDQGIDLYNGTALGTDAYWSASEVTAGGNDAQSVVLATGTSATSAKTAELAARAVREFPTIDLSENGSANCYIVSKPGTTYMFDARVKGNGKATLTVNDPNVWADQRAKINANDELIAPKPLAPQSAFTLWSTGAAIDGVVKNLKFDGERIYFTTAGSKKETLTQGNAVIAVKDAGGNIIWSWHIWATDYDPTTDDLSYINRAIGASGTGDGAYVATVQRTFTMMGRNLGSFNNTPGNLGSFGLLYQWGRKDPFIGSSTVYFAVNETTAFDDQTAKTTTATPVNTYKWQALANSTAGTGADASIAYAIAHPTHLLFLKDNLTLGDWLNVTTTAEQRDYLWGNPNPANTIPNLLAGSKSIYDPCPPGYRVPRQDSWTRFTTTGMESNTPSEWNTTTTTWTNGQGWAFYYKSDHTGNATFYPATGFRNYNNGMLSYVGTISYYWSASPYYGGNQYAGTFRLRNDNVNPLNYNNRTFGFSVRCAKE